MFYLFVDWLIINLSFVFLLSVFMLSLALILLIFDNPIYSIFYLVLVFFCSSFVLILLNLSFLGLMILIVYLGALVVLFLFVVMMLNIKTLELYRTINFFPFVFIFVATCGLFVFTSQLQFFDVFYDTIFFSFFFVDWSSIEFYFTPFVGLATVLYTFDFVFVFLMGLILLLSMLGAIILTLSCSRFFIKQVSFKQLFRSRSIFVQFFGCV